MAYKQKSPQPVVEGGTGATSYTAGSVVFSNGTILTQDNSNLFWDDTNNRLGIGTITPLDELHVVGSIDLVHTALADDEHALEIDCDAAGFGDIKAVDINYTTGTLAAGDDEEVMLVNINEAASTGGEVSGYQILATEEGSATIHGYTTGININPILHNAGTFGDADDILNKAVDVTAALASGGAGSITAFVLNSETMTFGDAAQFNEMEFILGTEAGGAGIAPTFEFSTGGTGFTTFVPADGTNGLRNSGAILWVAADLVGWVANATGFLEVRMTRNRVTLPTIPILDEVQIVSATEYTWDKAGDLIVNSIALSTALTVANGGTGVATITGVLTGNGTSAVTASAVTDNTVVMGSTSNLLQDTTITVTDAGEMTNASQPSVSAKVGTTVLNQTGDGTAYTVIFNTEFFDQNGDYNTSNGTFTAPVTGKYRLTTQVRLSGLGAANTTCENLMVTSNNTYSAGYFNIGAIRSTSNAVPIVIDILADMDAADTNTVWVNVFNGTKIVDIDGTGTNVTWFTAQLEC